MWNLTSSEEKSNWYVEGIKNKILLQDVADISDKFDECDSTDVKNKVKLEEEEIIKLADGKKNLEESNACDLVRNVQNKECDNVSQKTSPKNAQNSFSINDSLIIAEINKPSYETNTENENQDLIPTSTDPSEKNNVSKNKNGSILLEEKKSQDEHASDFLRLENIENEVLKLNLPKTSIDRDWRKIINNEIFSDVSASSKDGELIFMHSLVLKIRCLNILDMDYISIFKKFNLPIILVFLEYLYCGTLNDLQKNNVKELVDLAKQFNYLELIEVINDLEKNIINEDNNTNRNSLMIREVDFNTTLLAGRKPGNELENNLPLNAADRDLFEEDMIDLTQSDHGSTSSTVSDNDNDSNLEKSYWSFLQQEKKKEKELKEEEERESFIFNSEMEKIQISFDKRNEMMEKMLKEFDEEQPYGESETEMKNWCTTPRREESRDSSTRDADDEVILKNETNDDCIIISSDSESQTLKPIPVTEKSDSKIIENNIECDVPYFDPYEDNFPAYGFSPVQVHSQSLIAENNAIDEEDTLKASDKIETSTPLSIRRSSRVSFYFELIFLFTLDEI